MFRPELALAAGALVALISMVAACRDDATGSSPAPTATASASAATTVAEALPPHPPTGVSDCDAYFAALHACFAKADPALRAQLLEAVERYDNQLDHAESDVAKQAVGVGCAAARDALNEEPACR